MRPSQSYAIFSSVLTKVERLGSGTMRCWRGLYLQAGVTVKYRIGRKLVEDRRNLQEIQVTESQFADYVALYTKTREDMEQGSQ